MDIVITIRTYSSSLDNSVLTSPSTAVRPRPHQENCKFAFSAFPSRKSGKKREKAEKAGKLRHSQAGSTAIKHEKHEKQRQFS